MEQCGYEWMSFCQVRSDKWQSSYKRCRKDEIILCCTCIDQTCILKKASLPYCEHCQCILFATFWWHLPKKKEILGNTGFTQKCYWYLKQTQIYTILFYMWNFLIEIYSVYWCVCVYICIYIYIYIYIYIWFRLIYIYVINPIKAQPCKVYLTRRVLYGFVHSFQFQCVILL